MLELKIPYKKNDAVTIKLSSSEEIIARFVDEDSDHYVIEKPVILIQGQQGVGMMPWMMSAEDSKITLNKRNVVAVVKTMADVAKAYTENTSSIQLV